VAVAVAGIDVPTFYHRAGDVHACLGEAFALDRTIGIGVFVPPPYLERRWQRVPAAIRRAATGLDHLASSWPLLNQLGDHTLTCWIKRRVGARSAPEDAGNQPRGEGDVKGRSPLAGHG
jgi:hypothetical protein